MSDRKVFSLEEHEPVATASDETKLYGVQNLMADRAYAASKSPGLPEHGVMDAPESGAVVRRNLNVNFVERTPLATRRISCLY
jgi:hypothetical protein